WRVCNGRADGVDAFDVRQFCQPAGQIYRIIRAVEKHVAQTGELMPPLCEGLERIPDASKVEQARSPRGDVVDRRVQVVPALGCHRARLPSTGNLVTAA